LTKPVVVKLAFRALGQQVWTTTDGRYVAIERANNDVTLLDERRHTSVVVTFPDCPPSQSAGVVELAGPWLAEACPGGTQGIYDTFVERLYSLATGQWRNVAIPWQECVSDGNYGETGGTECQLGPLGADWLSWTERCWNCGSQSGVLYLGRGPQPIVSVPDTSPTTALDYSAPTLLTRLCAPLRNSRHNQLLLDPQGQFTAGQESSPLGRFAVALDPTTGAPNPPWTLERCGSRLRRRLPGSPITGNPRELLFYSTGSTIRGMFFPSLRRFTVRVPASFLATSCPCRAGALAGVILSDRNLYVVGRGGELWEAPAPAP
jgi:hypothetical protein